MTTNTAAWYDRRSNWWQDRVTLLTIAQFVAVVIGAQVSNSAGGNTGLIVGFGVALLAGSLGAYGLGRREGEQRR